MATLTYVYADQTAVLGPLATYAEPHTYDLCAVHADRLSAPRGWATVRLVDDSADDRRTPAEVLEDARRAGRGAGEDDLLALADAVREGSRSPAEARPRDDVAARSGEPGRGPGTRQSDAPDGAGTVETGRRGHLRVLRDH